MDVFEPLRDAMTLREAVNRLFEDSYVRTGGGSGAAAPERRGLPLDILEADDHLQVIASLPGCSRDKVDIQFQKDTLTIKAMLNEPAELQEGIRYRVRERWSGEVSRTVNLAVPIDAEKAKATFRDGVLTLSLPKAESVKPRSIPITD
ncbi:MAG: Hsp20/alpha crystallin family protein [Burkholderiales bacterium]|nr:Hsp20/alpha crystallin family protein [Burkholderiales bacterium]